MKVIHYKSGYKYQLEKDYDIKTTFYPDNNISLDYISLSKDGNLVIKKGYAWDGPSGPTIDTKTFMRGSLVHDAIYQLFRLRKIEKDKFRDKADRLLKELCKEDGMSSIRAWWVYNAVKLFAGSSASNSRKKSVTKSP